MDVVGALAEILKADTSVVCDAVFAGSIPREFEPTMSRKIVVLRRAGGGLLGRGFQQFGDVRVDVDCFGTNDKEASDLWDAVHATLKQLRRTVQDGVLIHWCECSANAVGTVDPTTTWPICLGSFQVLAAEVSAA